MNYEPPTLVYATRTSDITLNVVLQGTLHRISLPRRQAYHLMLTLMLALEQDQ